MSQGRGTGKVLSVRDYLCRDRHTGTLAHMQTAENRTSRRTRFEPKLLVPDALSREILRENLLVLLNLDFNFSLLMCAIQQARNFLAESLK